MKIADLVGSRGNDWHLLTSAAFISMLMPLAIFPAAKVFRQRAYGWVGERLMI